MLKPREKIYKKAWGKNIAYCTRAIYEFSRLSPYSTRVLSEAWEEGFRPRKIGDIEISSHQCICGDLHERGWKLKIGEQAFFVKEVDSGKKFTELAPSQFLAIKRLTLLETENIKVAEQHLAYFDGNKSYLVGKFYDLPLLCHSQGEVPERLMDEFTRFRRMGQYLLGVFDISGKNAFYDKEKNRIIVFDVSFGSRIKAGIRKIKSMIANAKKGYRIGSRELFLDWTGAPKLRANANPASD